MYFGSRENSATDLDELQMPSSEAFSRSSLELQPSRLTVSGREMKYSVQTAMHWKILCIQHSQIEGHCLCTLGQEYRNVRNAVLSRR